MRTQIVEDGSSFAENEADIATYQAEGGDRRDADELRNLNLSRNGEQVDEVYRAGKKDIEKALGARDVDAPGLRQAATVRNSRAQRDYDAFADSLPPDMPKRERDKLLANKSDQIILRGNVSSLEDQELSMSAPYGYPNTASFRSLDDPVRALIDISSRIQIDLAAGRLTRTQAYLELQRIDRWMDLYDRRNTEAPNGE
jgi:hypothetical protein